MKSKLYRLISRELLHIKFINLTYSVATFFETFFVIEHIT